MAWLYTWTTQTPWELLLVIRCMPSQEAVLGRRCLDPSTPLFTLSVGESSGLKEEHLSGWCKSGLHLWTKDLGFKRAVITLNATHENKIISSCLFFFSGKLLDMCKQIWGWRAKQNHPLENVTFTISFCNKHSALFKYKTGFQYLKRYWTTNCFPGEWECKSSEWIKHLLLDAYWINYFLYREEFFTILRSSLNP